MKVIKFALPYHAILPPVAKAEEGLAIRPYAPPLPEELSSFGFVPRTSEYDRLLTEFEGGFAFFVRIDEKIIPGAAIASGLREALKKHYEEYGRYPGRKEKQELRENVALAYRRKALIKTTVIGFYYHSKTRFLVAATPSGRLADIAMAALTQAIPDLKIEPVHQSELPLRMTTRLSTWLDRDNEAVNSDAAFDEFELGSELMLVGERKKLTIKTTNIDNSRQAIQEAVKAGYSFKLARFEHPIGIAFRLDADFHLKGIEYENPGDFDSDSLESLWQHEASVQLLLVSQTLTLLVEMLGVELKLQS